MHRHGLDREHLPCLEINGKIVSDAEILLALIKTLIKKGVVTKLEIKDELGVIP